MTESRIQVGASQDYLNTNKITTGALNRLDNLEIVLSAYFMLQLRNRQNDDIAAMLMLGLL